MGYGLLLDWFYWARCLACAAAAAEVLLDILFCRNVSGLSVLISHALIQRGLFPIRTIMFTLCYHDDHSHHDHQDYDKEPVLRDMFIVFCLSAL